jgi:hypothetical protein
MSTLERAIAIAAQAHAGQLDKGGAPYILHPLRVMQRQASEEAQIVGVLHDLIERGAGGWTLTRLAQEGFAAAVLAALDAVSRREGEDEVQCALRAAADPLGRAVKLAELADNCDLSRIAAPTDDDRARAEKCREAIELIEVLGRVAGDPDVDATPALDLPDKVQIRYQRFERGYSDLGAYVDANGALVLDGCDAGGGVKGFSGDWDYEYTLTVPAAHRDRVLLQLVKEKVLSDDNASLHAFREWLQAHGIESTFWSY